ncbi:3-phosphoserine/phosphohydroxythreonine transaminase [Ferrimonas sediminicola]|uniref:Phosphoserine aminotransferase n=1 Tax=Ferrimonas sediminicola TaxID=2569538 RepID=A0A4U1BH80_9GAMM|nr:3-phosphoserine/phosphohydroxythreonine transaminase [Ferrimonas sediminicola]TKB50387.1 3-phosphoserine/phosphohydroxythreonine transaminase [Ferrimonas sediminicola]
MSVYNFCAGPAMLPAEVMAKAQKELVDFHGLGVSVMELSHRSKEYLAVANAAEANLRELMGISDDYAVLFTHGGARAHFSAIPLNLAGADDQVDYLISGQWSAGAAQEAAKYAQVNRIDLRVGNGLEMTRAGEAGQGAYLHYCPNETVDGVAIFDEPDSDQPLIADYSSCILGREIDINRYGLIYAGAQKNVGPAGLALVIVRRDLIGQAQPTTPSILDYGLLDKHDSMYNTPPTYAWYLAGEVFKWIKAQGGVAAMAELNRHKAALLYDFIDSGDFYQNRVDPSHRSEMNVPFQLANPDLDAAFLAQSQQAGLMALKGHRSVGGMRASLYNAMPIEGVQALVAFMKAFELQHK